MTTIGSGFIYSALSLAHSPPEWACFEEVANATGYACRRHADAVAMSLWPSRGLILRGFEIKVSRSDYKREAENPEKAEAIAAYCDEWYIVTPVGLIKDVTVELPPAWGLMEVDEKKKVRTRKPCHQTEAKQITRSFLAAMLRAAHGMTLRGSEKWVLREEIEQELEKAHQRGVADAPMMLTRINEEANKYRKAIETFKAGTGIDLVEGGWNDRSKELARFLAVGEAVVGRYNVGLPAIKRQLEGLGNLVTSAKKALDEVMPAIADS
jgi:hypothetical protein